MCCRAPNCKTADSVVSYSRRSPCRPLLGSPACKVVTRLILSSRRRFNEEPRDLAIAVQAQPKLEGMHCYGHLYKKALPEPERGAKSALDLASAWISSARRHPLVFDVPVLAHDIEKTERSAVGTDWSTQHGAQSRQMKVAGSPEHNFVEVKVCGPFQEHECNMQMQSLTDVGRLAATARPLLCSCTSDTPSIRGTLRTCLCESPWCRARTLHTGRPDRRRRTGALIGCRALEPARQGTVTPDPRW